MMRNEDDEDDEDDEVDEDGEDEDEDVEDEDEDVEDDDHDEHHACHSPALHHTPICAVERNQYRLEAISRKGKRFCRNIGHADMLGISGEWVSKAFRKVVIWRRSGRREGGREGALLEMYSQPIVRPAKCQACRRIHNKSVVMGCAG